MPKPTTFKVSRKGVEPVTVNFNEPESLTDSRWEELGVSEEQRNDLAVQSLVIKIQAGGRNHLDSGADAVQKFVDGYKYNQRTGGGGGSRKVTLSADVVKKAAFSPEQLEALRAAGITVPGMEETAPAPTAKAGK
jgi:hypothetical protein